MRHCAGAARVPRCRRTCGTSRAPSRDDGPQLDLVVLPHHGVGGEQLRAADDQDSLWQHVQLAQEVLHAPLARDLHLALGIAEGHLHQAAIIPRACYKRSSPCPRRETSRRTTARATRARRGSRSRPARSTPTHGSACAKTSPAYPTGAPPSTAWSSAARRWVCCRSWTATPCSW